MAPLPAPGSAPWPRQRGSTNQYTNSDALPSTSSSIMDVTYSKGFMLLIITST